jgi:superfamily II DNA or RNA helicase
VQSGFEDWGQYANCIDSDIMYEPFAEDIDEAVAGLPVADELAMRAELAQQDADREESARYLCRTCRVRIECLTDGLMNKTQGVIMGGLNSHERDLLLKRNRRQGMTTESLTIRLAGMTLDETIADAAPKSTKGNKPDIFKASATPTSPENQPWFAAPTETETETEATPQVPFRLRPYQIDAKDAAWDAVDAGANRVLVQMAVATGKTTVAAHAALDYVQRYPRSKIALFSDSEYIIDQDREEFERILGPDYTYDSFTGRQQLTRPLHETDFLFSTLQKQAKHRTAFAPDAFDMIVVDESHHTYAKTYKPTIDYFLPYVYLALSHTVVRHDGLDSSDIFGEPVFRYTMAQSIVDGWTLGPHFKSVVNINERAMLKKTGLSLQEFHKRFIPERDPEIVKKIYEEIVAEGIHTPHIIIYTNTTKRADDIAKLIPSAVTIHSNNSDRHNDESLEAFRHGPANTLVTVDMGAEGLNVPKTNVVVFVDKSDSEPKFYQQLGRAARRYPGQDFYLALDFANHPERIRQASQLMRDIEGALRRRHPSTRHRADRKPSAVAKYSGGKFATGIVDLGTVRFEYQSNRVEVIDFLRQYEDAHDVEGWIPITRYAKSLHTTKPKVQEVADRLGILLPYKIFSGGALGVGVGPAHRPLLEAEPELQAPPAQEDEWSTDRYAREVGMTSETLEELLKRNKTPLETLPRRLFVTRVGRAIPPEVRAKLDKTKEVKIRRIAPPGSWAISQIADAEGIDYRKVRTLMKEAKVSEKSGRLAKGEHRRPVLYPDDIKKLYTHPYLQTPRAPADARTMRGLAQHRPDIHFARLYSARDALGLTGTPLRFPSGSIYKGFTIEEQEAIIQYALQVLREEGKL